MKNYHPLVSHHLRVIRGHHWEWDSGLTSASVLDALGEGSVEERVFTPHIKEGYGGAWIRDNAYTALGALYGGDKKLATSQLHGLLDIVRKYENKLKNGEGIHAKVDPRDLSEITPDWGHRQHDAMGIVLWTAAEFYAKNKYVFRRGDWLLLQHVVDYLASIEYWKMPDFGMWEECEIRHSSSIGAVVGGLKHLKHQGIPNLHISSELILKGEKALQEILPYESRDTCFHENHYHCCDSAQLFLMWPYSVLEQGQEDEILRRILKGHGLRKSGRHHHRLRRQYGLQRYWGDEYGMTEDYRSVVWQWHPLVSIIFSRRKRYREAYKWLKKGMECMTPDGYVPEFRTHFGDSGKNTPLAWMHALHIVAYMALPELYQRKLEESAPFLA